MRNSLRGKEVLHGGNASFAPYKGPKVCRSPNNRWRPEHMLDKDDVCSICGHRARRPGGGMECVGCGRLTLKRGLCPLCREVRRAS